MEATLVDLKLMQEKKQLQTKNGRMHMLLKPIFNNSSVERVCNINSRRTCVARAMSGSRFIVNRHPDYEGPPDASQVAKTEQELGATLQKVMQHLDDGMHGGLRRKATCYTGNAGIAHAMWHLHTVLQANPSIAIRGGSAVLANNVVSTMVHLVEQALGEAAKGMHPSRQVSLLDGAAGVYMTGALVHSAAAKVASSVQSPSPSALHGPPPVGPEVQAPSLLQQQVLQGHIPGLLSVSQHWERCRQCCQAFIGCAEYALSCDSDEVLYGRAGYLLGALTLYNLLSKSPDEATQSLCAAPMLEIARQVALAMLDSGRKSATLVTGDPQPPLYYEWPAEGGSPYLGAAHGLMGILYAMLHCPPLLQDPVAVMDIKAGIRYVLMHEQDVPGSPPGSGGHYPTQMGQLKRSSDRVLVHWCHGAPGAVFLLCKAHEVFGGGGKGAAYLPAACRAGEVVWARGILRKGPGLCHGVAGNGFALHKLWKSGAGAKWLHRSQQFGLALGDEEVQQTFHNPDYPYSLFQGCAAGLSFLVDVLAATNTQHHHVASLGTDAGPVKPSNVPLMLGFPLYEP